MVTGGLDMEKIGVIGAGSWGTALAQTLAEKDMMYISMM